MSTVHAGPVELPNPLIVEGLAGGTFLPGNIVEKSGDDLDAGDASTIGSLLIACENGCKKISDAFAVGDQMYAYTARQGLYFRARLATGVACVKDETLLERGASGRLVLLDTGVAVAKAKETVTTSANDQLVIVEVL